MKLAVSAELGKEDKELHNSFRRASDTAIAAAISIPAAAATTQCS